MPGEEDTPPKDQLAKEWDNLECLSERENATAYLVFLTADLKLPEDAIRQSRNEFETKRPGRTFSCGWLSWRHVGEAFKGQNDLHLVDLVRVCKRLGLIFFSGISEIKLLPKILWRFQPNELAINWNIDQPLEIDWRFTP